MSKIKIEDDRTGIDKQTIKRAFIDNLHYIQGRTPEAASLNDCYMALAYTIRDRMLNRWLATQQVYHEKNVKTVGYLSAEFLMGPHLENNLINMHLTDTVREAMSELGLSLDVLSHQEEEPGLGNGGLGRLAACFLDSLATLNIPAIGYGIRYEFGIFDQVIQDGWQVEVTDKWLRKGNPWEIVRPEDAVKVKFGGHTHWETDSRGRLTSIWEPDYILQGTPYDTPVPGYGTNTLATLRLWKSEASHSFDLHSFHKGDYFGAVFEKMASENITKVLYPNDEQASGKKLRLKQQYFFVSCSLQDAIRTHIRRGNSITSLHIKFALQLNDTHPAIAIAELMRLLVDEWMLSWDTAWDVTQKTFGYTNHTLLPEALEKWPIDIFKQLLPRHIEIIYEINHRFLEQVSAQFPEDKEKITRLSIVEEGPTKYIRMAHLACIGSHAINGVAQLHSELVKTTLFPDFFDLFPSKFFNKTNGVTLRRWMVLYNPHLTALISKKIGDSWIKEASHLKKLEDFATQKSFIKEWQESKQVSKNLLAQEIERRCGVQINPHSMFDIQVKRIHEYKRQHLAVLHIITLYQRLKHNPKLSITPRTFIFGGKAAPSYYMAKLIIKLINSVKEKVNQDPAVNKYIQVVFIPDFNVSNSRFVYAAADLSEQISTVGKEASGTGNMKFTMNGALTIGTLDGANVELREEVGAENFFLFGTKLEELKTVRQDDYPSNYYQRDAELKSCLDLIRSGFFSPEDPRLFRPLIDGLLYYDPYLLMADYRSYITCQEHISELYENKDEWARISILNVARSGKFSSDRTIHEYAQDIWHTPQIPVQIPPYEEKEDISSIRFPSNLMTD